MKKITKATLKRIEAMPYYDVDMFKADCKTYTKAVKSGRILFVVTHVSSSGMSRNISIKSFEGKMSNGYFRQYGAMLEAMGYKLVNYSEVKVSGCGVDMVWNTNYSIIKDIHSYGLITKKSCDILSQKVNG